MFKTNKKIAKKLESDISVCTYVKEAKEFLFIYDKEELDQSICKKIDKLGLRIIQVRKNPETLAVTLKRKSVLSGIIIAMLSFQVVLFGIQMLWLATKTYLP